MERKKMQKFHFGKQSKGVVELVNFLSSKKEKTDYKVLDVGGAIGPYFWEHTDVLLDWNEPVESDIWIPEEYGTPPNTYKGQFIQGDITAEEGWTELLEIVSKNGKFDFVICRHTLEDIENPKFVTDKLQKVAKAGFIAFPGKHMEMEKGFYKRFPKTRGMHHHRWIFITKNGRLYGLPKMGWTDLIKDKDLKKMNFYKEKIEDPKDHELRFYWEDSIDVIYLHAAIHGLPSSYGDDFIRECIKDTGFPWEVWIKLLSLSD